MKILHLTFHGGCANVIKDVLDVTGLELTTKIVTSGRDGYHYNMTEDRAWKNWNEHKNFYNEFDTIITSDTAPLSRILLQSDYKGKIIVYISNRFDYSDSTEKVEFPDHEYYDLLIERNQDKNVHYVSTTEFESIYARKKGIVVNEIIKTVSKPTYSQNKRDCYVPVYLNDVNFNLYGHCYHLPSGTGRYKDREELAGYRYIVHLPYAWTTIALFDGLACGCAYYVPTKELLLDMLDNEEGYWFQNANYCRKYLDICEFYREENSTFIQHFSSMDNIKPIKVDSEQIYNWAEILFDLNQKKWISILNS